jgi:excisionase family DNA binding protein
MRKGYTEAGMEFEVMTITQVAQLLQLAERTIYRLARTGELPGRKIANKWRFERAQVAAWIRGERHGEPQVSPNGHATGAMA